MSEQRFFLHSQMSEWLREACPQSQKATGRHCWHHGGVTYTSNPGQHDEICCYCGEAIRVQESHCGISHAPDLSGHGPHHPGRQPTYVFNASRPKS